MKASKHVEKLLRQGRNPKELVELGFPKSVVTKVRRQLKKEKAARGQKGTKDTRIRSHHRLSAVLSEERELAAAKAPSEADILLAAAKDQGLTRQVLCSHLKEGVCLFWSWPSRESIPHGVGEPLKDDKEWRIKPSELYCALCIVDLEFRLIEVEGKVM
jgi:hypothetical protein